MNQWIISHWLRCTETLRKEKQLQFSKNIAKVSDLSTVHVATAIAMALPDLTAQALFQCGGELFEAFYEEKGMKK